MKILITGMTGQLGLSIKKAIKKDDLGFSFSFIGRDDLDFIDLSNITDFFKKNRFDVIVNCAAYTLVDEAEIKFDTANKINHLAVRKLAEICKSQESLLIHISTDYVFDGYSNHQYLEQDYPNPINVYGRTKLAGERAILEIMDEMAIIIRTSWVYSEFSQNFVKTMLRIGSDKDSINVVGDQFGAPTYAYDLSKIILKLISKSHLNELSKKTTIFHYSSNAKISWYEFCKKIFEIENLSCSVTKVTTKEYPSIAKRPSNSLLDSSKIHNLLQLKKCFWQDSLEICLSRIKE